MSVEAFKAWADQAAQKYNVPVKAYNALITSESNWKNIWAKDSNGNNIYNGGYGPAQIIGSTAKELNINRFDPRQNIEGGAKYFAGLLEKFGGDKTKAILAYKGLKFTPENIAKHMDTILAAGGTTELNYKGLNFTPGQAVNAVQNFSFGETLKAAGWSALLLVVGGFSLYNGLTGLIRGYAK